MGRYYDGDINGKFMFGVQSSEAANRFGVSGTVPGYLDYYFNQDDLNGIERGLEKIENNFGELKDSLLAYFDLYKDPDDAPISFHEYLEKGNKPKLDTYLLSEYADYVLGKRIYNCVKKHGECNFTAEL